MHALHAFAELPSSALELVQSDLGSGAGQAAPLLIIEGHKLAILDYSREAAQHGIQVIGMHWGR